MVLVADFYTSLNISMDLQHGVLLLIVGGILLFGVFCIIAYADKPKEDKRDKDNPVTRFWKDLN